MFSKAGNFVRDNQVSGLSCKGRKIFFLEMRFIRSFGPQVRTSFEGWRVLEKIFREHNRGFTHITKELRLYWRNFNEKKRKKKIRCNLRKARFSLIREHFKDNTLDQRDVTTVLGARREKELSRDKEIVLWLRSPPITHARRWKSLLESLLSCPGRCLDLKSRWLPSNYPL